MQFKINAERVAHGLIQGISAPIIDHGHAEFLPRLGAGAPSGSLFPCCGPISEGRQFADPFQTGLHADLAEIAPPFGPYGLRM